MVAVSKLAPEVARYYEGGKRVMIGGVPQRVPSWYRTKADGVDEIKAMVAANEGVDWGQLEKAPRFKLVPADKPKELVDAKPSKRGTVACRDAWNLKSTSGWKSPSISLEPMYHAEMAGDSHTLTYARGQWHQGNPAPLREWLADRRWLGEPNWQED